MKKSSMKLNESTEKEEDRNGLLVLDKLCKDDANRSKVESRLSEVDDSMTVEGGLKTLS